MRAIKILLLLIGFGLILVQVLFAQTSPEQAARKYGITFPIAELGNCSSLTACRTYCEDPANHTTCVEFAKKKGFHKEEPVETARSDFWEKTSIELGCDSKESCRIICKNPDNFDKCHAFAKKNNLQGGQTDASKKEQLLQKAKGALGCDSYESCMKYCSQEENKQKCSGFTQQLGMRGGERYVGPGGCSSVETCKVFCSEASNYQICASYSLNRGKQFTGPGGCNSEESCRKYCEQNPQQCASLKRSLVGPSYNPEELCSKTPQCKWTGTSCQCGLNDNPEGFKRREEEYKKFCEKYPDKCHDRGWMNQQYPQKYCELYPDRCPKGTPASIDPIEYCRKYPERCKQPSLNPTDKPTYYPPNLYQDRIAECTKHIGCTWTGSSCHCSSTPSGSSSSENGTTFAPSYDPATECTKRSNCSWTGSSCQCSEGSSVQGVTTKQPNFLIRFFEWLLEPRQ